MAQHVDAPAAAPAKATDELCPLRPGDGCRMCVPGATGPGDCGLVQLVTTDPELKAGLIRAWSRAG